ncbi:UNVERIFIED_ORG: hypothetical protein J2Y81_005422 [Paraburkholderia sediminicola]|nr:hypothetical protein [Paraburkholderia sediminicola]
MQNPQTPQAQPAGRPTRAGANADAPGSYTPVLRVQAQIVDPGEAVSGDIFFTGYGTIIAAKMVFYPATEVFEIGGCLVEYRVLQPNPRTGLGEFAIVKYAGDDNGVTILFPSWQQSKDVVGDYFFTVPENNPSHLRLHTEGMTRVQTDEKPSAPVAFRLVTRKTARPGTYPMTFVFTYFNGDNWHTVTLASTFTVRNILQRNEILFGSVAAVAAIATIGAAALTLLDTWEKVGAVVTWTVKSLFPPL